MVVVKKKKNVDFFFKRYLQENFAFQSEQTVAQPFLPFIVFKVLLSPEDPW